MTGENNVMRDFIGASQVVEACVADLREHLQHLTALAHGACHVQDRVAKIARREAVLVATESFQVIGQRLWHAGRAADCAEAAFASIEPLGSAGKNDLLVHQRHLFAKFIVILFFEFQTD